MLKLDILKEVGDSAVVDCAELIVYIESGFFDNGTATELGERIKTVGIFYLGAKSAASPKEVIYRVMIPSSVVLNFPDRFKTEESFEGAPPVEYECARLVKGDILIENLNHVQNIDSCVTFLKMFNFARIPPGIPYDSLVELYKGAGRFNGLNFRVPSLIVEIIISELCRKKSDPSQPFRLDAGKGKASEYKMVSIKKIAELSSVFNAISSENINQAIQTSIRSSRAGKKQRISPIEKTIYY